MMAKKIQSTDSEEEIKEAFHVFDRDKQGSISVEELRFVMRHLQDHTTEDEIEEMLREADQDQDGRISYEGKDSYHGDGGINYDGKTVAMVTEGSPTTVRLLH